MTADQKFHFVDPCADCLSQTLKLSQGINPPLEQMADLMINQCFANAQAGECPIDNSQTVPDICKPCLSDNLAHVNPEPDQIVDKVTAIPIILTICQNLCNQSRCAVVSSRRRPRNDHYDDYDDSSKLSIHENYLFEHRRKSH